MFIISACWFVIPVHFWLVLIFYSHFQPSLVLIVKYHQLHLQQELGHQSPSNPLKRYEYCSLLPLLLNYFRTISSRVNKSEMKSARQQQQRHSNNDSNSIQILEFRFWLFKFKQIFFVFRIWKRVQHIAKPSSRLIHSLQLLLQGVTMFRKILLGQMPKWEKKLQFRWKQKKSSQAVDPYACAIKIKNRVFGSLITVGYIPREISRHFHFFIKTTIRRLRNPTTTYIHVWQ